MDSILQSFSPTWSVEALTALTSETEKLSNDAKEAFVAASQLEKTGREKDVKARKQFTDLHAKRFEKVTSIIVATVEKSLSLIDEKYVPAVALGMGDLMWAVRPEHISWDHAIFHAISDDVMVFSNQWLNKTSGKWHITRVDMPTVIMNYSENEIVNFVEEQTNNAVTLGMKKFAETEKANKERIKNILKKSVWDAFLETSFFFKERLGSEIKKETAHRVYRANNPLGSDDGNMLYSLRYAMIYNHTVDFENYFLHNNLAVTTANLVGRVKEIQKISQTVMSGVKDANPNFDFRVNMDSVMAFNSNNLCFDWQPNKFWKETPSSYSTPVTLIAKDGSIPDSIMKVQLHWLAGDDKMVAEEIEEVIMRKLSLLYGMTETKRNNVIKMSGELKFNEDKAAPGWHRSPLRTAEVAP